MCLVDVVERLGHDVNLLLHLLPAALVGSGGQREEFAVLDGDAGHLVAGEVRRLRSELESVVRVALNLPRCGAEELWGLRRGGEHVLDQLLCHRLGRAKVRKLLGLGGEDGQTDALEGLDHILVHAGRAIYGHLLPAERDEEGVVLVAVRDRGEATGDVAGERGGRVDSREDGGGECGSSRGAHQLPAADLSAGFRRRDGGLHAGHLPCGSARAHLRVALLLQCRTRNEGGHTSGGQRGASHFYVLEGWVMS
mmetsp:Transcript_36372/g.61303  ORF Transcript_36372/g.61303 Transcript_36372/m.61303 type:complete len:252 (+) Transcript_36372:87-842(+)